MSDTTKLIYVPILHTQCEAIAISTAIKDTALACEGMETVSPAEHQESIMDMWSGISRKISETDIPCRSFRIYQDSLPVCGKERYIVEMLAGKNSLNHRLILELLDKGARLEGTEDSDLLVKECDFLNELLGGAGLKDTPAALAEYKVKSSRLMEKRDAFISDRIRSTIQPGETPLVFMGVRHTLERLLGPYFIMNYIIYRLPFKKAGNILNG